MTSSAHRTKIVFTVLLTLLVATPYLDLTRPTRNGLAIVLFLGFVLPVPSRQSRLSHSSRGDVLSLIVVPAIVSFLGVAACVVYARHQFPDFLKVGYDDSFITFRYARNFADFKGLRFNLGDDSNSASSLTFALLLSVFDYLTPLSYLWNANLLNLVGLFALLFWPIRFISARSSPVLALLVSVPLASVIGLFPPLVYWTFSGMETTFFLGLLMMAVVLTMEHMRAEPIGNLHSHRRLLILFSFLTLTRVEGALAAGTLGVLLASSIWRDAGRTLVLSRELLRLTLVAPLVLVLQLCFYWRYYSSPISDPIRFKDLVMYYQRSIPEAASSLEAFLFQATGPHLLLLAVSSVWLVRIESTEPRNLKGLLPAAMTFISLGVFGLRSPFSDEQRYELMLVVPLGALMTYVVASIVSQLDLRVLSGKMMTGLLVAGLFIASFANLSLGRQINDRIKTYMYVQQARIDAGAWLEANTPRGSRVVSSDIGALSFFNSNNVYLDAAGLVNRSQLTAVRNGADIYQEMKNQRPEFLVDTVDANGVSGVEQILSDPLSYYIPDSRAHSSCRSTPIFLKQGLKTFPDVAPGGLQVRISRIVGFSC